MTTQDDWLSGWTPTQLEDLAATDDALYRKLARRLYRRALRDAVQFGADLGLPRKAIVNVTVDLITGADGEEVDWILASASHSDPGSGAEIGDGTWHILDGTDIVGVLWSKDGVERVRTHPDYSLPLDSTEFTADPVFSYQGTNAHDPTVAAFNAYACNNIEGAGNGTVLKKIAVSQGSPGTQAACS